MEGSLKEALSAVVNTAPAPELSWRDTRCMGQGIPPHSVSSRRTGVATAIPSSRVGSAIPSFCIATTSTSFLALFFIRGLPQAWDAAQEKTSSSGVVRPRWHKLFALWG